MNAIKCLSVLQELDSDPVLEELNKDLDFLDSGKAPGNESIPAEVRSWSAAKEILLICELLKMLCPWLTTGHEGCKHRHPVERQDICISLLSVTGKLFPQIHWKGSRFWRRDSTQNRNVASKPTGQPLMWCSPSNSCRRTAGNNGNHSS